MRKVEYIVIHCTAAPNTQKTSVILDFWKNKKGWKSVGYHKLISADGSVEAYKWVRSRKLIKERLISFINELED